MSEQSGVRHEIDADGIARVIFDTPGARVNLLGRAVLEQLNRILTEFRGRSDLRGVLLASGKPGTFIAGMNVEEIGDVTDNYRASEGARFGQAVFQRIAELSVPTVCAIGGPCMGGGTEMALACSFRVAADDPAVRIGLPEVKLGIIPGFGGTQRLPRLVGLTSALDLILTGRALDAGRARRVGLVDLLVPAAYLEREAVELLQRAAADGVARTAGRLRRGRSLLGRATERIAPARRFVLEQARKRTAAKVNPDNYPAPFRAIESIDAAYTQELPQGLDHEARILGELVPTSTSKNLIWLFKSQSTLKKNPGGIQAAPRRVRRAAVLGAGIMGGGISQLVADRGIPVRLKDIRYEAILQALQTAHGLWSKQVRRKRLTPGGLRRKLAGIAPTLDDSGLRHVDLVVEAVVEDLGVKQKLLASIEKQLDERTVFASNTSSLPITDIAARALHPERVVGLHFFNPVHRMPLVEVIPGERTSPEAVVTVHKFARELGKVPVVVRDSPGFLVNRILTFYMNEALQLVAEGVRIEAADRAMRGFGMPMGPLELLDAVGLDTAAHVGEVLRQAFGDRVGSEGSLLRAVTGAGRLGVKNGKGFYRYRDGKRTTPDPEIYALAGSPAPRELPAETLQERMVLAMVNEAAVCLEDRVVREPREIDVAMVMGTGFPPFRGGLLRHADSLGIPIVTDRLSRLADSQGERFRPAGMLGEMVRGQRRFYS